MDGSGLRALGCVLFLISSAAGWPSGTAQAADNVTLILNATPNGLHAGIVYGDFFLFDFFLLRSKVQPTPRKSGLNPI